MKKTILAYLLPLLCSVQAFSQTQKFDIATFIPPQGWQRIDTNGKVAFLQSKTTNGQTSFAQIVLFPGTVSTGNVGNDFKMAWNNLITIPTKSTLKPKTETSKTPDGWTVMKGAANVSQQGMSYTSLVVTATGFGKTMSVLVNIAGSEYVATVDKFFNDFNLDSKATVSNNRQNTGSTNNQPNMNGTITLNDYDFIAPQGWQVQNNRDHILIQNMASGCAIRILAPQPSSGNLEQDVNAVFEIMYKGWSYQGSGEKQFLLAKGVLPKGQEYYRKEATMTGYTADGRYNLEEGTAAVVKAGNQIVILSVRHNSSAVGHDDCYRNYNTLGRFFNSFAVKNTPLSQTKEDAANRIVGLWKIVATGVVVGDYAFAANGNFQSGGGLGSSTTTSDMDYKYIYNRAYPFEGDGSYSVSGNRLTLKKRGSAPETVTIRFEKVSYGGKPWKDRIYMLKRDALREYESTYEKQTE